MTNSEITPEDLHAEPHDPSATKSGTFTAPWSGMYTWHSDGTITFVSDHAAEVEALLDAIAPLMDRDIVQPSISAWEFDDRSDVHGGEVHVKLTAAYRHARAVLDGTRCDRCGKVAPCTVDTAYPLDGGQATSEQVCDGCRPPVNPEEFGRTVTP